MTKRGRRLASAVAITGSVLAMLIFSASAMALNNSWSGTIYSHAATLSFNDSAHCQTNPYFDSITMNQSWSRTGSMQLKDGSGGTNGHGDRFGFYYGSTQWYDPYGHSVWSTPLNKAYSDPLYQHIGGSPNGMNRSVSGAWWASGLATVYKTITDSKSC
jgi:hypothetical protein